MAVRRMLVVAAERERAEQLAQPARAAGVPVEVSTDIAAARAALTDPAIDALALDLTVPTLDRAALLVALDPGTPVPPEPLDDVERRHIARTLAFTGGNRRHTAQLLGIARSTLLFKLRRYGLDGG
ncbi:MAG: helix-turn-helix domain-containing protein [Gemmatimonadales bacterium]|nr:helix-turn-helix domain-containing protein [Gemmatimonadales bacterium]